MGKPLTVGAASRSSTGWPFATGAWRITVHGIGRPPEGHMEGVAALAAKGSKPLRVFHTLRDSCTDAATAAAVNDAFKKSAGHAPPKGAQFGLVHRSA